MFHGKPKPPPPNYDVPNRRRRLEEVKKDMAAMSQEIRALAKGYRAT